MLTAVSSAAQKSLSELNVLQVKREQQIHRCAPLACCACQVETYAALRTCSRLHHANVLELYAVFEDFEAYYFVMQCVPASPASPASPAPRLPRLTPPCRRYVPRGDLFHELKRCGGCFSERCVSNCSARARAVVC